MDLAVTTRRPCSSRWDLLRCGNSLARGDALLEVEVLQLVEERPFAPSRAGPPEDPRSTLEHRLRHALVEKPLPKGIISRARETKPVEALGKAFKWGCRRVDAVVACVGRRREPELLPVRVDQTAQRSFGRVGWVGRPSTLPRKSAQESFDGSKDTT